MPMKCELTPILDFVLVGAICVVYFGGEENILWSPNNLERMDTLLHHMHIHIRLATKVNRMHPTISTLFVLPQCSKPNTCLLGPWKT